KERNKNPDINKILKKNRIKKEDKVSVCGLKYLEEAEIITGASNKIVTAMIVDGINSLIEKKVEDVTKILMHPTNGLRTTNEVEEIVSLEFGAARASLAVQNVIEGLELDMTEFQAVSNMGYAGEPLSAHVMFASGKDDIVGLSSPSSKKISVGDGVTTA